LAKPIQIAGAGLTGWTRRPSVPGVRYPAAAGL